MSLTRMVFREIDVLFHRLKLLTSDLFSRPAGAQRFETGADHIDIFYILGLDPRDKGSPVGDDLYKPLQLQLPQRFPHGSPGHAELFSDPDLFELLVVLIPAVQNILPDLGKNTAPQGILVCYFTF